jgi:hypothetical protein
MRNHLPLATFLPSALFDTLTFCGMIPPQFNSSNLRLSREVEGTAL